MSHKLIDTGIFVHDEVISPTPKKKKTNAKKLPDFHQVLHNRLKSIESIAKEFLAANGIDCYKDIFVEEGAPSVKRDFENMETSDAIIIWTYVQVLRHALEEKDSSRAALIALTLGERLTTFYVRPYEEPAVVGRKVRDGGKKGRSRISKSRFDAIHQRNEGWRKLAEKIDGSTNHKARIIAQRNDWIFSKETIRKVISNK